MITIPTPVAERLAGELSYQSHQNHILLESLRFGAILRRSDCLFLRLNILSRPGIEPRSSACEANVRPTAVEVKMTVMGMAFLLNLNYWFFFIFCWWKGGGISNQVTSLLIKCPIHLLSPKDESGRIRDFNWKKYEMCEMVSKCVRKLDHYGRRSNVTVRCIYCKYMLKIMKKDVTHIPSVSEA